MQQEIYTHIKSNKRAQIVALIDPDKFTKPKLLELINLSIEAQIDYFFVGGSLLNKNCFEETIEIIKANTEIPVIIFPGNHLQISAKADAILFLSLISGRNPTYLIGEHVIAAPLLNETKLEVISCGYMLIDGGKISTTSYITQTLPIPADKPEIALATALAGQYLGMKTIYLEAGSGASSPIPLELIQLLKSKLEIPLIVGGGLDTAEKVNLAASAGASIVVIGNILETNPHLLVELKMKKN